MSEVLDLKQKRARIIEQMREAMRDYTDARDKGDNVRAEECLQRFDKAEVEEAALSKEIQRLERLEAMEREAAAAFIAGQKEPQGRQYDYVAAFTEWFRYGKRAAPEALQMLEKRGTDNQVVGTPALGGYTVPEGFLPELIKTMKDYSGIFQAARILETDSGQPLMIPTLDDVGTEAALVAEAASTTVQDITFGQKELGAYAFRSLAKFSWELLQDSAFNLPQEIAILFGERFGRALERYCTIGTGVNQPQGILPATQQGKEAASQTAITAAEIMDLQHSVDPAYRRSPRCAFMMHDKVLAALKKLQLGSNDASPLWLPSIRDGEPDTILGFRYYVNQHMPDTLAIGNKVIMFGDFGQFVIRMVQQLTIQRLDELYAQNGLVGFHGFMRFDSELLNPAAVKHLTMKTT